ncbi:MAG: sulfite exporter TauE/SafE family protein [Nitrososphaerota archaeon]
MRWGLPAIIFIIPATLFLIYSFEPFQEIENLMLCFMVGFIAQLIDGAIGMAYGVISNSFLLSMGVPPALSSAGIHIAEVFTTLMSGISHLKFGNVDKRVFRELVITGMIGGCIGAYILSSTSLAIVKTLVNIYLLSIGVIIFVKAIKFTTNRKPSFRGLKFLGGIGGFLDAIGGGGWGPIVTSTLVTRNHNPRFAIGSANLAEFFVTIVESLTFFVSLGMIDFRVVIGLAFGGLAVAPIAAYLCKKAPIRLLMALVAVMVIILAFRNLL